MYHSVFVTFMMRLQSEKSAPKYHG